MDVDVDPPEPAEASEPTRVLRPPRQPRPPREPKPRVRRSHRSRRFRGGVVAMVIIAGLLAVITTLVATVIYASVDAKRVLVAPPSPTTTIDPTAPPTVASTIEGPTSTRPPENLSPDELAAKVGPTVRLVRTFDPQGQPVQGTAFVVGSSGGQTFLVTSFAVVKASVRTPAPDILLDRDQKATLWTWQEDRDLALLVVPGNIESLPWATDTAKAGDRIFAAGAGQKVTPGVVSGIGDVAIEHNIFIDDVRQGAPIVNQRGEIVAMASKVYNPTAHGTDTLFIAIPIRQICERLLRCGGGNTNPSPAATTTTTTTKR